MRARLKWLGRRNEDGSIILFTSVAVISTFLVVTLMGEVLFGMSLTSRNGASSNALQVADAGVNDAVQQIPLVAGTSFTRSATIGNGTYTYTATEDATYPYVWHVDSVGVDSTGVKRHVKADAGASAEDLDPLYIKGTANLQAGVTLDSFSSGLNSSTGCTGQGILGMSDGNNLNFTGSGIGNNNCAALSSMDQCVVYGSSNLPPTGVAKCPAPPKTYSVNYSFPWSTPTNVSTTSTLTCNSSSPLTPGTVYYAQTLNLNSGCYVNSTSSASSPVVIYVPSTGAASINISGTVNAPSSLTSANQAANCPGYTSWTYIDFNAEPAVDYCSGWSSKLQIYTGGASVNVSGHSQFWGIINAPNSTFNIPKSANHFEMWGSMVINSLNIGSQANFHYDTSASSITQSTYTIQNWREEPVS